MIEFGIHRAILDAPLWRFRNAPAASPSHAGWEACLIMMRHPFPRPALGVRIIGEVTPERVEIVRKADFIFMSMIKEAGLYNEITQAYAALDSNRAVGVQGDARVYGYICVLRAVTSLDIMSAEPFEFPWSFLKAVSRRIVNEVDGIARVVYDTTSKPPGTIELE